MYKEDLREFGNFFDGFDFEENVLRQKEGGLFFGDECVVTSDGEAVAEGNGFVNVGYKLKSPYSKLLSNLFPYSFDFMGKRACSIEAVLQSLKFRDANAQDLVLHYFGTDANNIKFACDSDWQIEKMLFWQGAPMSRFSLEYRDFILTLYVSAIQNPLYRNALKNVGKTLIHTIGEVDPAKTVLSRSEFEKILNALRAYLSAHD